MTQFFQLCVVKIGIASCGRGVGPTFMPEAGNQWQDTSGCLIL